jgi:O-antigen/teichoic acid export membrane protein
MRRSDEPTNASNPAPADGAPTPIVAPQEKRLGRNVGALAGGQVVTWTMTLVWTLVVPRALGPAGFGVIMAAIAVTGIFAVVFGLGTRNYLVREIVANENEAPRLLGTAVVLRFAVAPILVAAAIVYAHLAGYGHTASIVLYVTAVGTIFALLADPLQGGFQAIERMEYMAYSDVINKSAQALLGVALALLGFREVGIAACAMSMAGIVLILNAAWLRGHLRIELRTNARALARMIRESVAYWAFGIFFVLYLWIDMTMLSLMTSPEEVGWYAVPTRLFQTAMFFATVVATAWLPRLVRAFQESPARLRTEARRPLDLVLLLGLPIGAAIAAGADPVVNVLYGSAYAGAVPVLVVLGLCIPAMYANIMLNQVLIASKRQSAWTWAMVGATVVNPVLNLLLIPLTAARYDNGAIGAAIALLLTEVIVVAFGIAIVGSSVLDRRVVGRLARMAAASAALWVTAYATRPFGPVASLAAAALAFVAIVAALRILTAEETAFLRSCARRAGARASLVGARLASLATLGSAGPPSA